MTPTLTHILRHPIKGIGSEYLEKIALTPNRPMPEDRAWAFLHEGAEDTDAWQARRNFLVVASGPKLASVTAETGEDGTIVLSHPTQGKIEIDPHVDGPKLLDWVALLWPEDRPKPRRLVRAPEQGMADNGLAQVSLMNHASLRAFSQKAGVALDPRRFRGNLWLDGLAPWEEFDWIGRRVSIGPVTLDVTERIERCRATEANPETGLRDVNTLSVLTTGWGHRDFGVYATIVEGGEIAQGDPVIVP